MMRNITPKKTRNKYNAAKVMVDGYKFDSRAEAGRYQELKLLEMAGDIKDLVLQPRFELYPSLRLPDGTLLRSIHYTPDFQYIEIDRNSGKEHVVVEEVKGYWSRDAKLRVNLFRRQYQGIDYRLIMKDVTLFVNSVNDYVINNE